MPTTRKNSRLPKDAVLRIFCMRPNRSSADARVPPSRVSRMLAQEFDVCERSIRDIWNRCAWRAITLPLWSEEDFNEENSSCNKLADTKAISGWCNHDHEASPEAVAPHAFPVDPNLNVSVVADASSIALNGAWMQTTMTALSPFAETSGTSPSCILNLEPFAMPTGVLPSNNAALIDLSREGQNDRSHFRVVHEVHQSLEGLQHHACSDNPNCMSLSAWKYTYNPSAATGGVEGESGTNEVEEDVQVGLGWNGLSETEIEQARQNLGASDPFQLDWNVAVAAADSESLRIMADSDIQAMGISVT